MATKYMAALTDEEIVAFAERQAAYWRNRGLDFGRVVDAVVDGCMEAAEKAESGKAVRTYQYRAAQYKINHLLRAKGKKSNVRVLSITFAMGDESMTFEESLGVSDHPLDSMVQREEVSWIRRVMATDALTDQERTLIRAIYTDDLTLEATGKILGMAPATVMNLRNRTLDKLRKLA